MTDVGPHRINTSAPKLTGVTLTLIMIILTEVSFKAWFTSTDVGARGILTNSIIQAGIVYQTLIDVYVTVFPLPSSLALTCEGALSIDTQRIVLTQGRI